LFYYKIDGLEMEWQRFVPALFPPTDGTNDLDSAILNTLGWQPQAELIAQNIGFLAQGE
jgi:hypothetical protein